MNQHLDHAYKLGQQLAAFEKQASLARMTSRIASRGGSAFRTARAAAMDYGALGAAGASVAPFFLKDMAFFSPEHFQRLGLGTGLGALMGGVGGLAAHKIAPRNANRYADSILRS